MPGFTTGVYSFTFDYILLNKYKLQRKDLLFPLQGSHRHGWTGRLLAAGTAETTVAAATTFRGKQRGYRRDVQWRGRRTASSVSDGRGWRQRDAGHSSGQSLSGQWSWVPSELTHYFLLSFSLPHWQSFFDSCEENNNHLHYLDVFWNWYLHLQDVLSSTSGWTHIEPPIRHDRETLEPNVSTLIFFTLYYIGGTHFWTSRHHLYM